MTTLFGIGMAAIDEVIHVDRPIAPGEKHGILQPSLRRLGGTCAVALATAARLNPGLHCIFGDALGDGQEAELLRAWLREFRVEILPTAEFTGGPGEARILIDPSGERTVLSRRDRQEHRSLPDEWEVQVGQSDYVLLDHTQPHLAVEACRSAAHQTDVQTIADFERRLPALDPAIERVDHLIVPESFLFENNTSATDDTRDSEGREQAFARQFRRLCERRSTRPCTTVTSGPAR